MLHEILFQTITLIFFQKDLIDLALTPSGITMFSLNFVLIITFGQVITNHTLTQQWTLMPNLQRSYIFNKCIDKIGF